MPRLSQYRPCRAPGVGTRWHRPNKRSDPAEGGEEEPEGTRHATTLRPFCDSLSLERAPTKSGPTQSVTDARLTQPPYTYRNLTASLQLSCTSLLAHANRKRSARHSSTATRVSAPWPHAHEHRSHPNSITGRLAPAAPARIIHAVDLHSRTSIPTERNHLFQELQTGFKQVNIQGIEEQVTRPMSRRDISHEIPKAKESKPAVCRDAHACAREPSTSANTAAYD